MGSIMKQPNIENYIINRMFSNHDPLSAANFLFTKGVEYVEKFWAMDGNKDQIQVVEESPIRAGDSKEEIFDKFVEMVLRYNSSLQDMQNEFPGIKVDAEIRHKDVFGWIGKEFATHIYCSIIVERCVNEIESNYIVTGEWNYDNLRRVFYNFIEEDIDDEILEYVVDRFHSDFTVNHSPVNLSHILIDCQKKFSVHGEYAREIDGL